MRHIIYGLIILFLLTGVYLFFGNNYTKSTEVKVENSKDYTENKKEYKIVAFGDSLTAGYGVELRDSYPAQLEEKLNKESISKDVNFKVVNMGVSGETTTGGRERVSFIISQNPDLVLLGLGANDMLRATDPSLTKTNLEYIIKTITEKNIPVILLGMESQTSNGFQYKTDFDDLYKDLSDKYKLPRVPFFLSGVTMVSSLNISDAIHPNRGGYEKIINENIFPVLLPFLKSDIYE